VPSRAGLKGTGSDPLAPDDWSLTCRNLRVGTAIVSLRIGPRKALGLAALVLVAVAAVLVWRLLGTDGLLILAIVAAVGAPLVVAWFVLQAERRTAQRIERVRAAIQRDLRDLPAQLETVARQMDELSSRVAWDGERADRFLTALDGRLTRTERLLEALTDRLS